MKPTAGIVTMWFNEAKLAPLFLRHYAWADDIHVILDADTNDASEQIVRQFPNARVSWFIFPDGMDDDLKIAELNRAANDLSTDWRIALDADEFIFPRAGRDPHEALSGVHGNVITATLYQVYRHATETEIAPDSAPAGQRRYGDPNVTEGVNRLYNKPCIVRSGFELAWTPGCHSIARPERYLEAEQSWVGAHWAMADPELAIERRIRGRRDRMSQHNLEHGLTKHNHAITEAEIRRQCAEWAFRGVRVL